MRGRELLLKAMRNETTPRAAWLPFVGCHGAKLIGRTATEYLKSADLMVEGLKKARELYRPDGLPVCFDLQVEAEALGCRLHWADDVPPSVMSHPLAEGKALADLPAFDPHAGRIPAVLETLRRLKQEMGKDVALYGLVCGPFTLALHLLGNDLFLLMFDDPAQVQAVMAFCADVSKKMADLYLRDGADVVALVDPMTSQISPDHFAEFVAPAVNDVFDHIRAMGGLSALFVCGDVTRNLEAMCRTTCDSLHVDEQIDMVALRKLAAASGKAFGGNMKLTVVLLLGTASDARHEALALLDTCGTQGFILSPGCDLPFDVPPGNLQAVGKLVHDRYVREATRAEKVHASGDDFADITLPDYPREKQVIVDVITLDSTSCAPCQYMVEAVEKAVVSAGTPCVFREHKIKTRQGIGMMVKLGVKALPTICIDGRVAFISIIPDQHTLVTALLEAAKAKG